MKKIATILILASVLLIGGVTLDAKTTKKSKAKTSQTSKRSSKPFVVESFMESIDRGFRLKDFSDVKSILTSKGYKYVNSVKINIGYDCKGVIERYKDSKGNKVELKVITEFDSNRDFKDINEIVMEFISSTERNNFLQGYRNGQIWGAHDNVILEVNGNTVKLYDDCYYCD